MKVLKVILFVLLALVGIVIVMGLIGPKTYKVERSAVITASPEAVWPHVSSIRKQSEWSPFIEADTTMVIEYYGNDGEVGSGSKWTGKDGKGEQTIMALDPNKSVNTHLKFIMPWGTSESDAYLNLEPDAGGTKVTWGFGGNNDFIGRIFSSLMSLDKVVGPMYEDGLAKLQTIVASAPRSMAMTYDVTPGQYAGGTYLGIKDDVKIPELTNFYTKNFASLMGGVQKAGIKTITQPLGIYYTWDLEKMMTNMAAAVGVTPDTKAPAGLEKLTVAPGKSLTITYKGGYNGMGDAHNAMDKYIQSNKLEHIAPVIEEYVLGPAMETDSNKWVTTITYLVK
ncbi:MAG: SRPBCC family protein [Bacteroidota bacterium]|nr:SRPBCC family protein [Bacteroidota bacterium]